jgi:hypothetical protein
MARSNPDRFTSIPVPVKILKLLIAELDNRLDAEGNHKVSVGGAGYGDFGDDELEGEDWEDVDEEDEYQQLNGEALRFSNAFFLMSSYRCHRRIRF